MSPLPLSVLLVAVSGALGASLRHLLDVRVPRGRGVLTANLLACLVSGLLAGSGLAAATPAMTVLLIAAGGLTLGLGTWSTVAARAWGAHLGGGLTAAVLGGLVGLTLLR